jgi:peptidoglycan pentaglycine glycine transferase (the first glycine)
MTDPFRTGSSDLPDISRVLRLNQLVGFARCSNDGGLAPEGCSVRISRERRDPDWDIFLERCPGGHYEQTSLWGEVKSCYGWRPLRIIVRRGERILAGVQVLTTCFGRWGRIGYVMRGPSVISNDPELVGFVLEQLDWAATREKLAYLVVVPPYNGHVWEPGLNRLGFRKKPKLLPPGGVMTATLLLDLSVGLDKLKAGMRKRMRENLWRATRSGVTVREGTGQDVETFRQLMLALCQRRKSSPTPPQSDFFENVWRIFQPSGFVRLFVAELNGRVISALLTFPFGDTVRAWKIGWAGDQAKSSPNAMLYWEAIRWSKHNGYRYFDIVQIDESLARKLRQGDPVDWTSVGGMSLNKLGFGASPFLLPEPYYRFYHPLLRIFAQAGGSKLIESPRVTRLLERFWSALNSEDEGGRAG